MVGMVMRDSVPCLAVLLMAVSVQCLSFPPGPQAQGLSLSTVCFRRDLLQLRGGGAETAEAEARAPQKKVQSWSSWLLGEKDEEKEPSLDDLELRLKKTQASTKDAPKQDTPKNKPLPPPYPKTNIVGRNPQPRSSSQEPAQNPGKQKVGASAQSKTWGEWLLGTSSKELKESDQDAAKNLAARQRAAAEQGVKVLKVQQEAAMAKQAPVRKEEDKGAGEKKKSSWSSWLTGTANEEISKVKAKKQAEDDAVKAKEAAEKARAAFQAQRKERAAAAEAERQKRNAEAAKATAEKAKAAEIARAAAKKANEMKVEAARQALELRKREDAEREAAYRADPSKDTRRCEQISRRAECKARPECIYDTALGCYTRGSR